MGGNWPITRNLYPGAFQRMLLWKKEPLADILRLLIHLSRNQFHKSYDQSKPTFTFRKINLVRPTR